MSFDPAWGSQTRCRGTNPELGTRVRASIGLGPASLSGPPPDILLLAVDWRPRALIRAQLIEDGFGVVATNSWPMMRRHLRPGMKPRLVVVDLQDLPDPATVLNDLRVLMKPDGVLILTALGTLSAADVEHLGFRAVSRPIVIGDVIRAVAKAMKGAAEAHQAAPRGRNRHR